MLTAAPSGGERNERRYDRPVDHFPLTSYCLSIVQINANFHRIVTLSGNMATSFRSAPLRW